MVELFFRFKKKNSSTIINLFRISNHWHDHHNLVLTYLGDFCQDFYLKNFIN
jgi:hypothetical protein